MHVPCVSSVYMLQALHLDVSKVDWVLHMRYAWEAGGVASDPHVGPAWRG
jgi:hypothetical protein